MTAVNPGSVYASALQRGRGLRARHSGGGIQTLAVHRWLADAGPVDERVIERAVGPVLDVGCGPGRHVHALALRGVQALGLDASPTAIRLAHERGAEAVLGDVFTYGLEPGAWRTILLLDGNLGIGGDPVLLLKRTATLLASGGSVLLEADAPGTGLQHGSVRLEDAEHESHWFPWARVGTEMVESVAHTAGLRQIGAWEDTGHWFAELAR
jgi:SAM-dependent methyltransferase